MNVIILGPPGAGKGTQSNKIVEGFSLKQVSTGDLLRNEIILQTAFGKKIESLMNNGELVSDELVNELIENVISNPKNFNRLIFDGYPRTLSQIYNLEKILKKTKQKIAVVLSLTVNKDIISKRINGRIICTKCLKIFNTYFNLPNSKNHDCDKRYLQKRTDDSYKIILNRFESYITKIKPMIDYYKKKVNFVEIDGNQEIDKIYNRIKGVLGNIRDWHYADFLYKFLFEILSFISLWLV